jgi:TolB-like protein/DNA-binding winged helix-turn-helix (wHTH) protein
LIYVFADLCLDTGRRQLSRGIEAVKLPNLSFKLLEALVMAAPGMLTQDDLIKIVWGPERIISSENLSQRVTMLRQSLGEQSKKPVYIETVYGQGFRLIPDVSSPSQDLRTPGNAGQSAANRTKVHSQESTDSSDRITGHHTINHVKNHNRPIHVILVLLVLGLLGWTGYMFYLPSTPTSSAAGESINTTPTTVAVLPFINISNDDEQEYFVDGVTEEILNGLVKIEGLLITGRTSSFAYKNQNIDLREIAKELNVEYLLEGSVRKNGDVIRVTVQLIDAASGAHVFSRAFNRKLVDVFALQNEISRQVAAELKVSLIHKDDQYNTALSRLDAIAIEQLFTARAQIARYSGAPVRQALDTLGELNSRYPKIPEIMGLIARGHMIYGSIGAVHSDEVPLDYVNLARTALKLDPANLDALITLAVTSDDFAVSRIQAIQYYQKMLRFHPGRKEAYSRMLTYLEITYTPGPAMKAFLDSAPVGAMDETTLKDAGESYDRCSRQPWQSKNSDDEYSSLVREVKENPNQRFLSILYMEQLKMGAWDAARKTDLQIDYDAGGWWVSYAAGYKLLFSQLTDRPLEIFLEYFIGVNYGSYDRSALFLAYHGAIREDYAQATQYLDKLPDFPIEVANQYSAVGLMVLQHRAGKLENSSRTAKLLLQAMNQYQAQSPGSYRYHNLAKNHMIAAFYASDFDQARHILDTGFPESHSYWLDDIAVIKTFLAPWHLHPVAMEYMERIEQDRRRAREKFGFL